MKQIGLHESWLNFLYEYVSPLQEHVFIGYNTNVRVTKKQDTYMGISSLLVAQYFSPRTTYKLIHRCTNFKLQYIIWQTDHIIGNGDRLRIRIRCTFLLGCSYIVIHI